MLLVARGILCGASGPSGVWFWHLPVIGCRYSVIPHSIRPRSKTGITSAIAFKIYLNRLINIQLPRHFESFASIHHKPFNFLPGQIITHIGRIIIQLHHVCKLIDPQTVFIAW